METDSKFNLTDSVGNVLSNEFDSEPSIDNLSIDEKTGCVDIELPFEPRENGLFNVCLLVGYNYMNGEAYVKNVFPAQVNKLVQLLLQLFFRFFFLLNIKYCRKFFLHKKVTHSFIDLKCIL